MRNRITRHMQSLFLALLFILSANIALAQTTQFTYQGKLTNSGSPANDNYIIRFGLFDSLTGGTEISFNTFLGVPVTNGIFTVNLDFGAAAFTGANRFLEISVVPEPGGTFTVLSPRQQITSTPYSIRSSEAAKLEGIAASGFIQNTTAQQAATNFNISGAGTANSFDAATQYNIGGSRVLSATGANLFAGISAGAANTSGFSNSFFGFGAGQVNNTGFFNSFFGAGAGFVNTNGSNNSFFGQTAGQANTSGANNAFFGQAAGAANTTGSNNTLLGAGADTAVNNLSFAAAIGAGAVVNASNTLVLGRSADTVSAPGSLNVAGTAAANLFNATTQYNIGGNRILSNAGVNNLFAGVGAGQVNTGGNNSFFGAGTGQANTTGGSNSFFGAGAGTSNTTGSLNSFFGVNAGLFNSSGGTNSFFGQGAGQANGLGSSNSFFGALAGQLNTTGDSNSFFGSNTGVNNNADDNSFFGASAGIANTTGSGNAFFGRNAGLANTMGNLNSHFGVNAGRVNQAGIYNSFFGAEAGFNTTGSGNTFVGVDAGLDNTTGSNNTAIGFLANVAVNNLDFATAIGANATVSTSNTIALGRATGADTVQIPGSLRILTLPGGTATPLCINGTVVSSCSSSLRYKNNVFSLRSGLEVIKRLRPVTFDWKTTNEHDLGLIAEEVAAVEPLLVTHNATGEIEGVKYNQLSVVLINAVREQQEQLGQYRKQLAEQQLRINQQERKTQFQQEQIKEQQNEMDALKRLVCLEHPQANICKTAKRSRR